MKPDKPHDLTFGHYYTPEGHEHRWVLWDRGEFIYSTDNVSSALDIGLRFLGRDTEAYLDFVWAASGVIGRVLGGRQHILYASLLKDTRYVRG